MYSRLRNHVHILLEPAPQDNKLSRIVDGIIIFLILGSVISIMLESVEALYLQYKALFRLLEVVTVSVFTVEYVLRVWSCTENKRYASPLFGRLRYMISPFAIIDLVAILPFFLPLLAVDLRFIRSARLIRTLRLLKIGRYSESMTLLGTVIKQKKEELFITLLTLSIILVIASSILYHLEHNVQPEAFSSIPAAMWWGIATLTTVGYGDVYPVTVVGKIFGAVIALMGIGLFALPAGILGSGFVEVIQRKKGELIICPHCGKTIEA